MDTNRYPKVGDKVRVVQKKDYNTGKLTEGVVKDILTKKIGHPRGTKVRLTSAIIGRVQEFVDTRSNLKDEAEIDSYYKDPDALV